MQISAANYFSAEAFSYPLACLGKRERGTRLSGKPTKIQRLLPRISYVFASNYAAVIMVITVRVSHRLLIPAAYINPVFMIANVADAAHQPVGRLLLLLPLLPLLCCCCCWYCCCCCCIVARRSTNGRESHIKSRKIENGTASCCVTVRLNVETRMEGKERAMWWKRQTRVGANISRPYLIKSHQTCAFFLLVSC